MRRKLGSLMCLNNIYESQVDWFAHFYCTTNNNFFLIIIAETLIKISIDISGFSASKAQLQAPLYYVTINLCISWTPNEWEGTVNPTPLRTCTRLSAVFKVMEKALKFHHRTC